MATANFALSEQNYGDSYEVHSDLGFLGQTDRFGQDLDGAMRRLLALIAGHYQYTSEELTGLIPTAEEIERHN